MNSLDELLAELEELHSTYKGALSPGNREAELLLNRIQEIIQAYEVEKGDSPLSKRETEILTYVSKGFTNREIASALSISSKTIEYHLKNIYVKSETSGRAEAISYAITKGWIKS